MKRRSDPDDAPPLTGKELSRPDVKWRIAGKEVSPEVGKAAFRAALGRKTRVNIHFDDDVIAHFKAKAKGRGYQTLINATLRRDLDEAKRQRQIPDAAEQIISTIKELKAEVKELKAEIIRLLEIRTSSATLNTNLQVLHHKFQDDDEASELLVQNTTGTSESYGTNFRFLVEGHA
jgi:uncharacterized protein (DUF4415 family)/Sec-independent protein translocase protein TatA